jgi:alkylated DNA nucleotide flippase Atl1
VAPRKKPKGNEVPAQSERQGLPVFARLVLDTVDSIPSGNVMAYGDIAEYLGQGGPRLVARMMSLYGSEVPWWRVLRANGSCAPEVIERQLEKLAEEQTPMRTFERVDMARARWDGQSASQVR